MSQLRRITDPLPHRSLPALHHRSRRSYIDRNSHTFVNTRYFRRTTISLGTPTYFISKNIRRK